MIYGSALHAAVAEFHKRHARGEVMTEDQLVASFQARLDERGVPVARARGGAARRRPRSRCAGSARSSSRPGAIIPAYVEREFSFLLDGDRVRGRFDRVDITPRDREPVPVMADDEDPASGARRRGADADLSPEHVVITDYKSSDVRDPAKARQRAKDSLQLSIYAMGYEAMTGRLPDAVALHFLDSGLVGTAPVDRKRIEKAREAIRTAARGIRARDFEPKPDYLSCSFCAFREICPASVAR